MGARPISRTIDEKIRKPLANEIIHGKLIDGGFVFIDCKELNLILKLLNLKKLKKFL